MNIVLKIQAEAQKAFEDEDYSTAIDSYSELIDKHNAQNPYLLYMRAKSYHQTETWDNINKARADYISADRKCSMKRTNNFCIMRLKINYSHGLLEYSSGDNIERALVHFLRFLEIVQYFTSKRDIRKQMPEFHDMEANCKAYIE